MNTAGLKEKLITFTTQRYQVQSDKDLNDYIFSNYLFHSYDPALIEFVFEYRREISNFYSDETQLQEFIGFCIRTTKQYTYKRNQFINYSPEYDALLQAEYRDFCIQIKVLLEIADFPEAIAQAFGPILSRHHERLRLILASYCVSYQDAPLDKNSLLQTVPCEEYSAPLQLQILNIDIARMAEPVLDIGCGSDGRLVSYLRGQGLAAFGMDRLASSEPEVIQKDWFDLDSRQTWGTIIAHQSVSTHFIYNHLHNAKMAKKYAKLFMNLLACLEPGGEFYYAPGLPFFEDELEETGEYTVSKTPIVIDAFGIGEIAYSTKIRYNF